MLHNIKKIGGTINSPRSNYFRSALYDSTVLTVICETVSPLVTYCEDVVITRVTLQEDNPNKIPRAVAIAPTR